MCRTSGILLSKQNKMKKIYLSWILLSYLLFSCAENKNSNHDHEHEHLTEEHHDHEHEGHDHEHEAHEHEHEGHDHEHSHGESAESHAHDDEISFSKAKVEAAGLKTEVVAKSDFVEVIKTAGKVMAAQGTESTLIATVPGVVTLGKLPFIDGTMVQKGQSVLSLVSNSLSDGDVAARVRHNYEKAKKEYERMKGLIGDKIVSAKDFEQAKLNYENAKIAYDAIDGKQSAGGVSVVSPISGYLKNIMVKEGDYVTVGQPLATISQTRRLQLKADVSEKYYSSLPLIKSANFKTPYDDKLYKLEELGGRLLGYGKSSDSNSFYIPVTFEFDNKGTVIPGSFVDIYLLTSPVAGVISVPRQSLIEEQGLYFVYLKVHDEAYKKQEVSIGADNGERVRIISGLNEGDEVVVNGAYQIKLSSASNAIPAHSHSH